jgi:CheY-like chemotaxis protein
MAGNRDATVAGLGLDATAAVSLASFDVPSLPLDADVDSAIGILAAAGRAWGAVVDADGRVLGLFAARDAVGTPRSPSREARVAVGTQMRPIPCSLGMTATVRDAARLLLEYDIPALPIVDGDTLHGFVTRDQLLSLVADPRAFASATTDVHAVPNGNRRVLVIEDDDSIGESLVHLLEDEGYVAVRARNGNEALEALRIGRHLPGLIVLDLMMPTMNGWEFRAAQLADAHLATIPVIVLSAQDAKDVAPDELGDVRAHLQKPVDVGALLAAIAQSYGTRARGSTIPPRHER